MLNESENSINEENAKKLKCLYHCQNEIPKLIEIDEEKLRQTWDEHHVQLKLVGRQKPKDKQNNELNEKKEYELENIFEGDVNKILILGGGGAGKSTLLHYISYKWGKEELWRERFDFIFRIKLKHLLSSSWKDDYCTKEIFETNKLACFIHYNLAHQYLELEKNEKEILEIEQLSIDDISNISHECKVLLLVDGYNEISYQASRDLHVQNIMKSIYEHENVILSSRPNALKVNEIENFDRVLENKALDLDNVTNYIASFYKEDEELGASLISFLERNYQVRGICEMPINVVLLCLIWGDENIKKTFQNNSDVNIQLLYHEVILWLGKKYLVTFDNWKPEHIVPSTVFEQEIIQFLQKIAFDSFVEQGNFVSNKLIKKHLGKLNIGNIYKFGILTVVGVRTDIVNMEYQFIHPTFQEFLTALHLNSKLASNDKKEVIYHCNLIGQHRNEPKYLMMLKFLAGMVSSQQFRDDESKDDLVKRTWESFTCNVDGVLEFGLEAKVSLLMHLLEQSKVKGSFDERIPNLKTIQLTLEDEVLKDIPKWQEQIIESGFVSEKIKDHLFILVNENAEFSLNMKVALEIINSLINKTIFGGREFIFCLMMELVNCTDWQTKKLTLQNITNILDKTVSKDILVSNVRKLMELISDKNLKECVHDCLLKVVTLIPRFGEELMTYLGNIMVDVDNTDDDIKTSAVEFIPKLLHITLLKNKAISGSLINFALRYLTSVIENVKINSSYKLINKGIFTIEVPDSCINYKNAAITTLANFIPLQHPQINVNGILGLLTSIVTIEKINDNFKYYVIRDIANAIQNLPQHQIREISYQAYLLIVKKLENVEVRDSLWSRTISYLLELTNLMSSDQASVLKQELFNKFYGSLQNSKQSGGYNCPCMILLLQSFSNEDVWGKVCDVYNEMINTIKSSQLTNQQNNVFVDQMGNYIVFIIRKFKSQKLEDIYLQVETAFFLFEALIEEDAISCNVNSGVINAVHSVVLHLEANSLVNDLSVPILRLVEKLFTVLDKTNNRVVIFATCNSIVKLIEITTLLHNFEFINKIYTLFYESLKDPGKIKFKDVALIHIITIVQYFLPQIVENQKKISIVKETFFCLTNLIVSRNTEVYNQSIILSRIADLVEMSPIEIKAELANEMSILCLNIVTNYKSDYRAMEALRCVTVTVKCTSAELQNNLINQLFCLLVEIIGDENDIKYDAIDSISELISLSQENVRPTRALEVCSLLINVIETEFRNNNGFIESDILTNFSNIIMMMTLKDSVELLKTAFPNIREAVMKGLLNKFKSDSSQVFYIFLIDIFNIINLSKGRGEYEKQLYKIATQELEKIADEITEEGISWVKENLGIMPNLIETKIFLKRLYHNVLSTVNDSHEMSEIQKEFIVKCIEYGLTTTIKRKSVGLNQKDLVRSFQFELVFENISYSFTNVREFELESVVDVALKQDNLLAKQYQEYEPLFRNDGTGVGLPVAASDFKISSLVSESCVLHSEVWCMSLLHLSDQNKSKPSAVFALLERRNHFGYHLIYKIHVENQKLCVASYEQHPHQINTEFCTELFGQMHYDFLKLIKPRYYVSLHYPMQLKEGEILIDSLQNSNTLESNHDFEILHRHFQEYFDNISWDEYKIGQDVMEIKKDFLLKLNTSHSDEARRFSQIIDKLIGGDKFKEQQKELQNKIFSLEKALNENSRATQEDKTKIRNMLEKLKFLDKMNSEQHQRIVEMTQSIHTLLSEGELSSDRIMSLEQQCEELHITNTQIQTISTQIPQFNDPNVNYFGDGESNDDTEYYLT